MRPSSNPSGFLPDSDEFRDWLAIAKKRLGVKPATLCLAAGVSTNTLGKFEDPKARGREIHLTTAAKIYRTALELAEEKGVRLPSLESVAKTAEPKK